MKSARLRVHVAGLASVPCDSCGECVQVCAEGWHAGMGGG